MAKGMSLEEFRSALSSDATVENEKLKQELESLKVNSSKQIEEITEENEQYKSWCKELGNRCFVFTQGVMCLQCSVKCCEHAFSPEDMNAAVHYMTKNKLPRTEETYEKVWKFLNNRRNNRKTNSQ